MNAARKYLRAADIVAMTGMSLRTIRRWLANEILPSTKRGGARLVAIEALECLLTTAPVELQELSESTDENDI
jgi:predicted DNA-binding transcriptional regulator AlpA